MEISTNAIVDGVFNQLHACTRMGGQNISPDLQITDVPKDAEFLAIIIDDPDAKPVTDKTWVHWNILNIPATETKIEAGVHPMGEVLENSAGKKEYAGMCPPNGRHTYRIAAFALQGPRIDINSRGELTIEDIEQYYSGLIIDKAVITGDFTTPGM